MSKIVFVVFLMWACFLLGLLSFPGWTKDGVKGFLKNLGLSFIAAVFTIGVLSSIVYIF